MPSDDSQGLIYLFCLGETVWQEHSERDLIRIIYCQIITFNLIRI